jgi:phospholipid-transporting ATPase
MEVVKYQQAQLINSDLDMYYVKTDTPALCRTSSLVEELGMVRGVFRDKVSGRSLYDAPTNVSHTQTGILTCNEMEFRIACIVGVSYTEVLDKSHSDVGPGRHATSSTLRTLLSDPFSDSGNMAREFMALLAVCHTVIPEVKDGKMVYQASNPDKEALVVGAEILIHFGAPKLYVLHVLSEASSQFVERHVTKEVLRALLQVLAMRMHKLWDVRTGKAVWTFAGYESDINGVR